jgi:hypothetical protein
MHTTVGNDTMQIGVNPNGSTNSGAFVLIDSNHFNLSNRSPATLHTNPTFYVYSSDSGQANDFIYLQHNQTDSVINSGNGDLTFQIATAEKFRISTSYSIFGTTASSSTATPVVLSLGGTYASNAAGNKANVKFRIYDDGAYYGFGVSASRLEYQVPGNTDVHSFYTTCNTTAALQLEISTNYAKFSATSMQLSIGTSTLNGRLAIVSGTTAADGIYWGTDVTLYRSGTDNLKTDDKLDINKRVLTGVTNPTISGNAFTPNCDDGNMAYVEDNSGATLTISNHSGTPSNGQKLIIRIKNTHGSTALTLAFGTNYITAHFTLAQVTAGKTTYLGFIYNSTATAKWDLVAVTENVTH